MLAPAGQRRAPGKSPRQRQERQAHVRRVLRQTEVVRPPGSGKQIQERQRYRWWSMTAMMHYISTRTGFEPVKCIRLYFSAGDTRCSDFAWSRFAARGLWSVDETGYRYNALVGLLVYHYRCYPHAVMLRKLLGTSFRFLVFLGAVFARGQYDWQQKQIIGNT